MSLKHCASRVLLFHNFFFFFYMAALLISMYFMLLYVLSIPLFFPGYGKNVLSFTRKQSEKNQTETLQYDSHSRIRLKHFSSVQIFQMSNCTEKNNL